MRPTLRQLEYFTTVAELGAFGPAAARLHVTQPSLSKQIAKLEEELGFAVFERTTRAVHLTQAGDALLQQAQTVLSEAQGFRDLARSLAEKADATLIAGVLPSIGAYFMPRFMERLRRDMPGLRLSLVEGSSSDLLQKLESGELDFVVASKGPYERLEAHPLFEETLWISATPGDALLEDEAPLSSKALRGKTLLTLGPEFHLTSIVEALAKRVGATLSSAYRGASLDAIRQMAASGAGIAVLPSLYALGEAIRDPAFRVRRLEDADATHPVLLYWRRSASNPGLYEQLASTMIAEKLQIRSERAEKFQV